MSCCCCIFSLFMGLPPFLSPRLGRSALRKKEREKRSNARTNRAFEGPKKKSKKNLRSVSYICLSLKQNKMWRKRTNLGKKLERKQNFTQASAGTGWLNGTELSRNVNGATRGAREGKGREGQGNVLCMRREGGRVDAFRRCSSWC